MKIPKEEVEHIAKLGRLKLTEEEKEKFADQLGEIIAFVEKINELKTEDVQPTYQVVPMDNVFREDETRESLKTGDALANAPSRYRDYFKVIKIIE